jgi:uncharacterized YccA/Bax inhibitor family protein
MPNPVLNAKTFERQIPADLQAGWASPAGGAPIDVAPAPDEVSPWRPSPPTSVAPPEGLMTIRGIASATAVLITLLMVAAAVGWASVSVAADGTFDVPVLLLPMLFVGLGFAIATIFRPAWARFTAPLYALAEGYVVGAISHLYEIDYSGIVLQAVGLIMLTLFVTGRIRVTDKLRTGIVAATGAVVAVYVLSLVAHLFGGDIPFIHDSGAFGIVFSLVVVGIASANLLIDFDFCQRAVAAGSPKKLEWFAAFGLLLTLVWLYLELLRLLSKLQRR